MLHKTNSKLKDSFFIIICPAAYLCIIILGLIGLFTSLNMKKCRSHKNQHITSPKYLSKSEVEAILMLHENSN